MEHYYQKKQTSPLKLREIQTTLRGVYCSFFTGSGMFSPRKIDTGTKVLTEYALVEDNWKILDLGCAYGAVGITIAKAYSSCKITLTDINARAVRLAAKNIVKNNLQNAEAIQGDLFENIEGTFDTILLNPPQSAGKKICIKMFELSKEHLKKGGILQVVARHQKGGRSLSQEMERIFGNVKDLARKSGYRIYVSEY